MAKKSAAVVVPVALRPALPRSARQSTTKQKPSALLDTRVVYCGDNLQQLGPCRTGHHFFVSFDYSSDALQEIESFFKRSHKVIVALTVQEILDEHIARKLV